MLSNIAKERKKKSLEILRKEGVPYLEFFPPYDKCKLRTKEEISIRALCLMVIALRAEGLNKQEAWQIAEELAITNDFSPKELTFYGVTNLCGFCCGFLDILRNLKDLKIFAMFLRR